VSKKARARTSAASGTRPYCESRCCSKVIPQPLRYHVLLSPFVRFDPAENAHLQRSVRFFSFVTCPHNPGRPARVRRTAVDSSAQKPKLPTSAVSVESASRIPSFELPSLRSRRRS
jgi:hypothetical protein